MSEVPIEDGSDEVAAWGDGSREPLMRNTGFGLALGGLIVAFLGAEQNGGASFLSLYGAGGGSSAYRLLSGLLPVVMGAVGLTLGLWTLRTQHDKLARAIGAAALVVGSLTVVTGALGWWGQEIAHNSYCEQYSDAANGAGVSEDVSGEDFTSEVTTSSSGPDGC